MRLLTCSLITWIHLVLSLPIRNWNTSSSPDEVSDGYTEIDAIYLGEEENDWDELETSNASSPLSFGRDFKMHSIQAVTPWPGYWSYYVNSKPWPRALGQVTKDLMDLIREHGMTKPLEPKLAALFRKAVEQWKQYLCLDFEEVTDQEKASWYYLDKYFRDFRRSPGVDAADLRQKINQALTGSRTMLITNQNLVKQNTASTELGASNTAMSMRIGKDVDLGVLIHELGHSYGLGHTQMRTDRDDYIQVNLKNLMPAVGYNFDKNARQDEIDLGTPFDFGSIMMYAADLMALPGKVVMNTRPKYAPYLYTQGHTEAASFYDILALYKRYQCDAKCTGDDPCKNGGMRNAVNCKVCICPAVWGGIHCERRRDGCGAVHVATTEAKLMQIKIKKIIYGPGELGNPPMPDKREECNYLITAPAGKRISLRVMYQEKNDNGMIQCFYGCNIGAVIINLLADHRYSGFKICCANANKGPYVSEGNIVPISAFTNSNSISVIIEYKITDDPPTLTVKDFKHTKATFDILKPPPDPKSLDAAYSPEKDISEGKSDFSNNPWGLPDDVWFLGGAERNFGIVIVLQLVFLLFFNL